MRGAGRSGSSTIGQRRNFPSWRGFARNAVADSLRHARAAPVDAFDAGNVRPIPALGLTSILEPGVEAVGNHRSLHSGAMPSEVDAVPHPQPFEARLDALMRATRELAARLCDPEFDMQEIWMEILSVFSGTEFLHVA